MPGARCIRVEFAVEMEDRDLLEAIDQSIVMILFDACVGRRQKAISCTVYCVEPPPVTSFLNRS
jgi:hypothetical protein